LCQIIARGAVPAEVRHVARAEKSILVHVPAPAAYRRWTAYEDFPQFLDGVTRVTRRDDGRQHWDVELAGRRQEWDATIEEEPDRRVAWHAPGAHAAGEVELKPVEGGRTLVTLRLELEPAGIHDSEGGHSMVDRLVVNSLERFKAFAEPREMRRMPSEDEPAPAGAATVSGPEGELGGPLERDAGELPFSEHGRHHGGPMLVREDGEELLDGVDDAEPTGRAGADGLDALTDRDAAHLPPSSDANQEDNQSDWSRD
jgi:hypothetical protein